MLATFMTFTGVKGILTTLGDNTIGFYRAFLSADSPATEKIVEKVAEQISEKVSEKVAELAGVDSSFLTELFESVKTFIVDRFGEPGLYAAYIATAAITLFILTKLFKISFAILKLVVVPSIALAFAATLVLPQNFFYFLPVTVSLFSILLLFRG